MKSFCSLVKFLARFTQLFISGKFVGPIDISQSYGSLSKTYNQLFLDRMGKHSLSLVQRFGSYRAPKILDLGCGTGFCFKYFKKEYPQCQITGIDLSPRMINIAKKLVPKEDLGKVKFVHGDILEETERLPSNSYDIVTCLWTLGYRRPKKLLNQIYRVLKRNGTIGIICNSKNTLPRVRRLFWKVLFRYPYKARKIMFELPLPENKKHLSNLLSSAGFKEIKAWQDREQFSFRNGHRATYWIFNTGALAGYDQVLDVRNDPELFKYFADNWKGNSQGNIIITHKFVKVMAKK